MPTSIPTGSLPLLRYTCTPYTCGRVHGLSGRRRFSRCRNLPRTKVPRARRPAVGLRVHVSTACVFSSSLLATGMVSTATGALPTAGGALVDITGQHLGLLASAVSASYSGGSTGFTTRAHTIPVCTIVVPGSAVRCAAQAGVGANYTFVVVVAGTASAPSTVALSYAAPIINSVEGPGAVHGPAVGGVVVVLRGVRTHNMQAVRWLGRCGVGSRASCGAVPHRALPLCGHGRPPCPLPISHDPRTASVNLATHTPSAAAPTPTPTSPTIVVCVVTPCRPTLGRRTG